MVLAMLTEHPDVRDNRNDLEASVEPIEPMSKPVEQIGPLQLRVMHYIWKNGPSTVQTVMTALNSEQATRSLAYTTFLTVMRNLARRNLLEQKKTAQRSHMFSAAVSEDDYKTAFIKQVFKDYFNNDLDALLKYVSKAPQRPPTTSNVLGASPIAVLLASHPPWAPSRVLRTPAPVYSDVVRQLITDLQTEVIGHRMPTSR